MATYKITELVDRLCEINEEGYDFVNISELNDENGLPDSLSFFAVGEFNEVDFETVDSYEIPEDYDYENSPKIATDQNRCFDLIFSYKEIFSIKHAVDNALLYFKAYSQDESCSPEDLKDINEASVDLLNLQAKLANFLKHVKLH